MIVGAGAGAGAVVFRYLIEGFTVLFTGHLDYTVLGRVPNPHVPGLGVWYVLFVPAIGALIFGPLIERFARETRGHGVPEVMVAVAEQGGHIRPRVAVVKSVASALCIGSGGSVGREGPIVQIGSALGSALGQGLRIPDSRLRLLVACGAAGGISATFNAPLAGVFFALEIILVNFQAGNFAAVVISSVTADIVGRAAFGAHPFLLLPPFQLVSVWEYLLYAGLGVVAAVAGVAFIRALYGLEDLIDRVWRFPEWLRPAAGGAILGGIILALPQMYGVGYPVISRIIDGRYVVWFLLILLAGKVLATSLTLSSGGSGGVFAPSLFMGAALGTAFGGAVHTALPALTAAPGAYGLVGMAALFAAAARAPITAVLIVFELTGDYRIILPLMFAVALSTTLSRRLSRDTIYTLKLRRRGIDVTATGSTVLMDVVRVGDAMRPVPEAVPPETPAAELAVRLDAAQADALPVVDGKQAYGGVVTIAEVQSALDRGMLDASAADLARDLPTLRPHQSLREALDVLLAQDERTAIPVVDEESRAVVGWLGQREVLLAYSRRVRSEAARAGMDAARTPDGREPRKPALTPRANALAPPTGSPRPAAREADGKDSAQMKGTAGYRLVDVTLERKAWPIGRRLDEIALPAFTAIVALRRAGQVMDAGPDTVVADGDVLSIFVRASQAAEVADSLTREGPSRRASRRAS